MKVKYKKSLLWFIMAIIWFAITVFIFQKYIPSAPEAYLVQRIITLVILPLLIGLYYLAMPLINYCTLDDDKISIHKSAIIFRNKIKRKDLECCRVQRRDLEFYMHNGKSYAIHLDWCDKEEVKSLVKKLQSITSVYDGNSERAINVNDIDELA